MQTADILDALSEPTTDPLALSRRRFLQLALGAGAVAAVPSLLWGDDYASAAPLGPTDGVLVVVLMGGGNDGLNTLVPAGDPTYLANYGNLAIPADQVLPIGGGLGLHPSLAGVKRRYDAGKVALIQGVGYAGANLSHFESMAIWMSGWAGGITNTGWLGRYLSERGDADPIGGVVFGESVPLHFKGPSVSALSLPTNIGGAVGWLSPKADASETGLLDLLGRFDDRANERGALADGWNRSVGELVAMGARTQSMYATALPEDDLIARLTLAAKLVNLNAGTRVIGVSYGDFDTHAGQAPRQQELLARFDSAVDAFFANLDPAFAGRVTLLTMSEFGRRPKINSSAGTDHGGASVLMAIGGRVRGGLYGAFPSLTSLDNSGSLKATTDFRSVYSTALSWLGGNATSILGGDFGNLGFLDPPTDAFVDIGVGTGPSYIGPSSAFVPLTPTRVLDTRNAIGYEGGKPAAGVTINLGLAGLGGIPASGASAAVVNLTAADADGYGYVTVFPGGLMPTASNLNLEHQGQVRPNLVTATLAADGAARLYTYGGTHLIADVFGYYQPAGSSSAGRLKPVTPTRLLDTRNAIGYEGDKPTAGQTLTLAIAGKANVPPKGASAVVLNVTATEADGWGYITVFPEGAVPVVSNVNLEHAGQTIANQVIVPLGSDGSIRLFTYGGTHLLADIVGWFTDKTASASADGLFVPVSPYRVLDTRSGARREPGSVLTLPVAADGTPAAGARAIAMNVTVTDSEGWGFITAYPQGDLPVVSNLNVERAGQTIPNHVICPVGDDGAVRLYSYGSTHLIADVIGWFI